MAEHTAIAVIHGRDLNKIFDLAKEYFPTQGFKLKSENKPIMIVFKRGSLLSTSIKGLKITLTLSLSQEGTKTTIHGHYKIHDLDPVTAKKQTFFNEEINGFKNYVESSIPAQEVAPPKPSTSTCPKCGKEVSPDFAICPYCGAKLKESKSKCPNCGKEVSPDFKVCPYCGANLQEQS